MPKPPFGLEALGHLRIRARLEEVRRLSEALNDAAPSAGLAADALIDLDLAMVEAANNVVLHGYGGGSEDEIELLVRRSGDIVEVELRDRGVPIPSRLLDAPAPPMLDGESGRGLAIIRVCTDELHYSSRDGENRLLLKKRI